MKELKVCPSTLQNGYSTYSPTAIRELFNGQIVSHIFADPRPNTETEEANEAIKSIVRISLSGAQPKFSVIADNGKLRYVREREQVTFQRRYGF